MNPLTQRLPSTLVVSEKEYRIITDFRYWLQINEVIMGHTEDDIGALIEGLFLEDMPESTDAAELMQQIGWFLRCGEQLHAQTSKQKETFSYTADADYIIAAFQEFYSIDLMSIDDLHWWRFNILLNAMSGDSELKERVRFRNIKLSDIKDSKQRRQIKRIQRMIALPHAPIDDTDIGAALW